MRIGIISDTHGLLRPEAVQLLRGSEHIIHAGDIGAPEIIGELEKIAPVTAIRGNVDTQPWARRFAETEVVELEGFHIYVIHDANALDLNPRAAGFAAVISGHSHQPKQETKDGVLYFNPGSAGPRRFKLPVSVGRLVTADGKMSGEILEIVL
jgi:putative phosphoesterase